MYHYSYRSMRRLLECHPDLQTLFKEVIKHVDCTIICGTRSEQDQILAYETRKTKLKWPHSKHNRTPSLAVDVAPYPINWENTNRFYWFAGIVMGIASQLRQQGMMKHPVRFGGDWDQDYNITDQKFNDLLHFELVIPRL